MFFVFFQKNDANREPKPPYFMVSKPSVPNHYFWILFSFTLNAIFLGQVDFLSPTFDSEMIFKGCGALVFVIDARDDYMEALTKLNNTVLKAHAVNKQIKFEVFIHKVGKFFDDSFSFQFYCTAAFVSEMRRQQQID